MTEHDYDAMMKRLKERSEQLVTATTWYDRATVLYEIEPLVHFLTQHVEKQLHA